MKLILAGDHLAVEEVAKITQALDSLGIEYENVGAQSTDNPVPLQQIIPAVCEPLRNGDFASGILVCGTGAGVEIGANKFRGIRASLCRDSEQAKNARIYDNANVLCIGSWYENDVLSILKAWTSNEFDNDEARAQMLEDFEDWN